MTSIDDYLLKEDGFVSSEAFVKSFNNYKGVFEEKFHQSTITTTMFMPIYAALETAVVGMADWVSIKSRSFSALYVYMAVPLILKGRDKLHEKLGIDENTAKKVRNKVDGLYALSLSIITKPLIYIASGERNGWKIAGGTLLTMGIGYGFGPKLLNFIDNFDMCLRGVSNNNMYSWLKKKSVKTRKKFAVGFVASMIALTYLVYTVTPDKLFEFNNEKIKELPKVETSVEISSNNFSPSY
ncbi:MAG: hypothetical protein ABH828_00485 [archaeon]